MDELVRAAMAKWPHVPDCRDWLGLDARGEWYMRDDACQRAGAFPTPKGSRVVHDKLREFIGRNYECDEQGAWYFQNGPQRVFVELEAAPWIWRLQRSQGAWPLHSHTGRVAVAQSSWLDEQGRLFVLSDLGLGLVHSQDMHLAADALEQGGLPEPQALAFAEMPSTFVYQLSPAGRR